MSDDAANLSYESAGVNYDRLDAFKRACQREAATTVSLLASHDLKEASNTRGESAYLLEADDRFIAHVEEGLGTKNLVADAMQRATGKSYYANIGIDTVATIVNDLVTVGALPFSVAMHAAVGDSDWFADEARASDLARGFAEGCRQAGAVWGGGETPALRGIVKEESIVLAGSAIGQIQPKSLRIAGDVRDGDAIIFLASSGVQTNGLTLCRALADRLPDGFLTPLSASNAGVQTYGEALLDPSVIYVRFIADCQRAGLKIHYAVHVTGHGWRKLMRLTNPPFVYRITTMPDSPPAVFEFIQRMGGISVREMYATFNMGVGFAIYIDGKDVERCLEIARAGKYAAWKAGNVVKQGERNAVEIPSLNIAFEGDTLGVK